MAEKAEMGRRVLIVEDDAVLGFGLEDLLLDSGFVVVGVAQTLEKGLALIERRTCDAAIVDANLDGVSAAPIGDAMTSRGLPYIVLSGYSQEQQGGAFTGAAEYLQKPCGPARLIAAVEKMVAVK